MQQTLIESLKVSGQILLQHFNKPLTHTVKESLSSIVTEADFASDAAIRQMIAARHPDHNIISEETGYTNRGSDYTWIIDPLDGTSNFAAGIPWFGVLVTLMKGNQPLLAGAYLPVSDTLYFAEKGKGAFKNDILLPALPKKQLKESLFSFCVDYTDDIDYLNRGLSIYKYLVCNSRNIRSTNSLIDFLYVAEGRFGGVLNLFTRIWDIAGLCLVIEEAGGLMKNISGKALDFRFSDNIANVNFPVFAGNKLIVQTLEDEILKLTKT